METSYGVKKEFQNVKNADKRPSRFSHVRCCRVTKVEVLGTRFYCLKLANPYNSSIASTPFLRLLWGSSDWTVFTINVLTQTSVLLLLALTNVVSNNLRWSKPCSPDGISFLGFLALSPSTSPMALLSLVKSRHGNLNQTGWYWTVQRCFSLSCTDLMYRILISALLISMNCLLLLNMSVQQSCISSTLMSFPIMAGVRPFNETTLFTTDPIAIRAWSFLSVPGGNFA